MTDPKVGHDVLRAASILQHGGIVALPTETVYGLGALARDQNAVARIFEAKNRPTDHPLIVHVASVDAAREWSSEWPVVAELLTSEFWPGPLTIIVRRAAFVSDQVTGGQDTVALRVPDHPMTLELLNLVGDGVAAPSANRFGHVSPTSAQHVVDDHGDRVDYVLDGGPCHVGLESTIVDCTVDPPRVLRPGGVTSERLHAIVDQGDQTTSTVRAPGMLASHYAPMCRLHLLEADHAVDSIDVSSRTRQLDASGDPIRFARDMYSLMRRADEDGVEDLYARMPAPVGIGVAILDRLTKAAHRDAGNETETSG
ncbi:MAG: L-threonylcarbamoyladenylate synthase [Ilumatobacteraceae bacterium]